MRAWQFDQGRIWYSWSLQFASLYFSGVWGRSYHVEGNGSIESISEGRVRILVLDIQGGL